MHIPDTLGLHNFYIIKPQISKKYFHIVIIKIIKKYKLAKILYKKYTYDGDNRQISPR